jgi:glycosyltransferase involved in cell wall biosynthesis
MQQRIAIFIPNFSGGGAEVVNVRLANELAAKGHPVDIVVNQQSGVFREQVAGAVRVVDMGASRTITTLPSLVAYLRAENPAALIASLLYNNLIALMARYCAGWRGRLILCQHNTYSEEVKQNAKDRIFSAVFARVARRAHRVVAVSQGVADDLARHAGLGADHVSVIYNPIITNDFDSKAAVDPGHPWFGDGGPPVFVAVGRLAPQKDYPTLLEALAILRQSQPARLLILGEGALLGELTSKADELGLAQAVDFLGFRPNPLPYIARAQALVLTSAFEGFGNVLAEALACGTPVVSTACNGPVEILDNGRYGALAPIGDAQAIAAAMRQTVLNPPDRTFLRSGAERFRCEPIAQQYVELALPKSR